MKSHIMICLFWTILGSFTLASLRTWWGPPDLPPAAQSDTLAAPSAASAVLPVIRSLTSRETPLDKFALLLIDVQNDFWNPEIARAYPNFETNVRELLDLSRQEGIEVIHLRSEWAADGSNWPPSLKLLQGSMPCIEGTHGARPAQFAVEQAGEQVFYKNSFDGFLNEKLGAYLKSKNRRHLLVAGLYTEICVLSTTFGAVNRGYIVTLVDDCCAAQPAGHQFATMHYEGIVFDRITHDRIAAQLPAWSRRLAENGL